MRILYLVLLGFVFCQCHTKGDLSTDTKLDFAMVIHGGAGNFNFVDLDSSMQEAYRAALDSALTIGGKILEKGETSQKAVIEVIAYMEDNPLFNAGKGAVFTHTGEVELDASIMRGNDLNAGAVTGVKDIKNPIRLASLVMDSSKHVMFAGSGASAFADRFSLLKVNNAYFFTDKSFNRLQQALRAEKHGTVGCVALDKQGNICAGTSTGGMTNKKFGRVGDSPIIGAGTYANNLTCGVSATGHGEFFIRYAVAHDISSLMQYRGYTIQQAAKEVIHKKLKPIGANGGVVCLDNKGNPAMIFNTSGMFRGYMNSEGKRRIAMFEDE